MDAHPAERATDPAEAALARAARTFGVFAALGVAVALALWTLHAGPLLVGYVGGNALAPLARALVGLTLGAGALAGLATGALVAWSAGLARAEDVAHRMAPLGATPLLALLLQWRPWAGRDLEFLALATLLGVGSVPLWRLALEAPPVLPVAARSRIRERLAPLRRTLGGPGTALGVVIAGALAYSAYFGTLTIWNHWNLRTASFDLGVENNLMWNLVHGGPLFRTTPHGGGPQGSHLGFHHTYLSFVLAPLYRLAPRPETLLLLQAALIGFAAVPLHLLARRRLGPWPGALVAFAYLLYAPVHGSNLYDFHYVPLAPFFLWFALFFAEEGRTWPALAFALLAISVREDVAACVAVLGGMLVLTGLRPRLGAVFAALGLAHFLVVKMVIMPAALGGASSYVDQYVDLIPAGFTGFGGVLLTVLGNPGYTIHTLLEREKLVYALQIAAPLVFLPWRRPIGWWLSVPGFFFTLLGTRYPAMVSIGFQYTAFWTMFLFPATVLALESAARPRFPGDAGGAVRRRAWMIALATAVLVTSHQFGAVLQRNTALGGYVPFVFGRSDADRARAADVAALVALVPSTARIVSSEFLVPQVSSRTYAYTLRAGIFDAEWLLFDVALAPDETPAVRRALGSGAFGVAETAGDFVLARRGQPTARNAEVLARLPQE